ncbi:hypothetical protein GCM10009665_09580 [Kitasatospora nipponensis]|uniref:Tail protein n=1 Tax=Kitasatospora nipponensis TaxID=258049 RepID=A0ABP4GD95_9ACTN
MQSDDQPLRSALQAGERSYGHGTRLGGADFSYQVQSWRVDRAYTTDLPAAMRAFTGSSAAQLDLELTGAYGVAAPALYSPWAPRESGDAARPGQSVVQTTSLNTGRQLPVFRGTVRSRSADSGTDTVQITALDGAERLRGPAALPRPYAGFVAQRPIASATWCVDELLRQAGILTCPPVREGRDTGPITGNALTLVHASLHGGFAAAYGTPLTLPDQTQYTWSRAAAPYEMAVLPNKPGLTMAWAPRSRLVAPGGSILLEASVNTLKAAPGGRMLYLKAVLDRQGTDFGSVQMSFDATTGTVAAWSGTYGKSGGVSASWSFPQLVAQPGVWHLGAIVDTEWAVVGSVYDGSGEWVSNPVTVFPVLRGPDGVVLIGGGSQLGSSAADNQPDAELHRVEVVTDFATECVQVSQGYTADYHGDDFELDWTKGATLDDVTLPLYSIPAVSGSQWDVIGQIAAAALGTAEFDESGIFRWRNHTRFLAPPTHAQRTVTSVGDIASLTVAEEIDACRNYCVQPYQDWSQVSYQTATVLADPLVRAIASGQTYTVSYPFDEQEYDVLAPLVDDDTTPVTDGTTVLRFAATNAANAAPVKGRVETEIDRSNGSLTLTMRSWARSNAVYTVAKAGAGSINLVTRKPVNDPVVRQAVGLDPDPNKYSEHTYGRQQYTAQASDWVQDAAAAQSLADTLVRAGRYPVPLYSNVEVLYDPRLQLGDVIELVDYSGAYLDQLAWVVGNTVEAANDGTVKQTLTLRGASYNGGPASSSLAPESPADPALRRDRTYAQLGTRFAGYRDLTGVGGNYRDLWSR